MAYVNVAEWKTDQVCEWLKGLESSVLPYVHSFNNSKVNGQQLLSLRPEDLEQLGVLKLGHQEIILEAVEYLRNFHYELDRENLQLLALRLSCQAHSLFNELSRQTDSKPVTTQTLSDVVGVVTAIKPLVRWLDRQPFNGQLEYNDKKCQLLKLSIEMATCAQRDRFAEKPIEEIRTSCYELAKLADYIIQDISDPMILQPASLDLATLKKRPGDDLGFYILPSFHGTHQIAEIKFSSVAHQCGKMEEGDEIVQVNYQTVVGWERKNVLELFNESPSEVLLTLKRRPRHTKVYGQIYIKPYRLPSNKKTPYATRWQHNLPSPRLELLTIPDFTMPLPRPAPKDPSPEPPKAVLDPASTVTDSSESDSEVEPPLSTRLYASKPRSLVQRRATITGASPTTKHGIDIEQLWKELKQEHSTSFQLRDKAASCAHGLDTVSSIQRPQTCLGIEHTKRRRKFDDKKLIDLSLKKNFNGSVVNSETKTPPSPTKNDIIEKSSGDCVTTSDTPVPFNKRQSDDVTNDFQEMKNFSSKLRGKLDKSHSTPAYDVSDTTAIEIDVFESTNTKKITDNSSIKSVKTDKLNSRKKSEKSKINCEKSDNNEVMMEGSVADKIHYLEKKLSDNNHDCNKNINKILDTPKLLNKDETKNCQQDNWEISEQPVILVDPRRQLEHPSSRESSEEKTESTGSYMEGIYSSSSEAEVVDKNKVENKGEEVRTIPSIAPKREEPEMPKKPEVKVRLTPPEPPPRKYFTKPSPLVLTDPPRVPERPDSKQRPRVDGFEGYREFLERSTDFIDDPTTPIHDRRIDHFSYSEMYDHQMKENRQPIEKYEPFTEKFGNGIVSPTPLPEVTPRESPESIPRDSPDGAGCSTPLSPPESRPRTLEKEKNSEKGVVNRAMMVAARSIGLSGSSKLSSNSPRSNRKRNMLLAKRRNVSVKDIGTGDLEGWLTYRSRGAGGAWARSWFVLKGSSLYRFKTQESSKSDCLIVLPGFTGSQATEVKSRKFAFKVYHTGTVFYFAAETEDSLALWLDAINKATLGSDGSNRTSGLFSETDESDSESSSSKSKPSKSSTENPKSPDKGFGSLKKLGRKDSGAKEHDVAAASLDRKYLRFLSARTPNVPVPTAQFRSYRKVLPSPTPNNNNNNKKSEPVPNSPDLRVTVAGSTFYGLTASQSSTDVPSTSQDMGDYRQTSERSHSSRSRRPDDLRGFITLEEFMLASQPPQTTPQRSLSNRSASPRMTTFTSEHVPYTETPPRSFNYTTNGMIYGHPRNGEDPPVRPNYTYPRSGEAAYRSEPAFRPDPYATVQEGPWQRRQWEPSGRRRPQEDVVYYPPRTEASYAQRVPPRVIPRVDDAPQVVPRRFIRENGYSGSSGDLTCCSTASETLQRARREASVSRKGSFNLNDRQEKTWLDSLRRSDKKLGSKTSKTSLKNVAQYQPPPMPNSPFEQEGMRAAFEMHLDKEPKTSRFKNLFRSKSPSSKPNNLDLPKEQKTLLGSPRLHRALFRDRGSSQKRSGSQSPGDSGISQSLSSYSGISQGHTLSQSFSSVSSASDWSPDTPGANNSDKYIIHGSYRRSHRNMNPPTLPYIPPPTSPPPPDDYPGLEYPPVFEPGTYSLSDASLLKDKTKKRPSVDEK